MKGLFSWATVVLLGFVSLFFIMKLFSYFQPKPSLPPSPMALPVIGHFHLIGYRVHQSFHKLSAILRPLFHVMLGSVPFIVASDAAAARDILREHEKCFVDRKTAETITRTGSKEEARRFLGLLYEKAERRQEVDDGAALKRLSNNVICQMTMGRSCETDGEADQMMKIVEEAMAVMGTPNMADFQLRRRADEVHCSFDNLMERILVGEEAARKENSVKTAVAGAARSLLQVLLDIPISEQGSATDTASVTLEWALAELINHSSILRDARREIESVVGLSRLVEESDVPNLPLLHTIVKETLRLHSAFPIISRHSNAPCKIRGYSIPADSRVAINIWVVGRDPTHRDNLLEFQPEMFMVSGRSFGVDVKGQHFHLLPFGTGRRMCPGMSLALQLIHTTLANVMQCFELSIVGGMAEMTEGHGASLPRAHRLVGTPKARIKFLP
ncbi:unnamed protein product [Spirodela intermedia]|uniref:Uncharacterized protein n=1 Tax=Spirodela intermedia TaxID=51605 RepID=A0A7I8LHM7_SPIIN|nr:unnamed protein product [Spirodela intermedia]